VQTSLRSASKGYRQTCRTSLRAKSSTDSIPSVLPGCAALAPISTSMSSPTASWCRAARSKRDGPVAGLRSRKSLPRICLMSSPAGDTCREGLIVSGRRAALTWLSNFQRPSRVFAGPTPIPRTTDLPSGAGRRLFYASNKRHPPAYTHARMHACTHARMHACTRSTGAQAQAPCARRRAPARSSRDSSPCPPDACAGNTRRMRGETTSQECDLRRARSNMAHCHAHTHLGEFHRVSTLLPGSRRGLHWHWRLGDVESTSPLKRAGAMKMKRSKLVTGVLAFAVLVSARRARRCRSDPGPGGSARSPALIPGARRVAGEPRSGEPAVDTQGGGGATAGGGAAKEQRGNGAAQGDQGHARVVANAAGGGAHAGAGAHLSIKELEENLTSHN